MGWPGDVAVVCHLDTPSTAGPCILPTRSIMFYAGVAVRQFARGVAHSVYWYRDTCCYSRRYAAVDYDGNRRRGPQRRSSSTEVANGFKATNETTWYGEAVRLLIERMVSS